MSSSSRSRSAFTLSSSKAFTLSSSNRSILAWTTSGSERPCPTYRLVHERIGLSACSVTAWTASFEDVAFAPGHAAIALRMADPLGKRDRLPRGRARGAIPRSSRLIHEPALVEPLSVLAHFVAGHVVLRDRGRAAVRRGRRTGAARVHATGDTAVLIERRSRRRGGTAGLGRGALTQAGLRGQPGPREVRCRARSSQPLGSRTPTRREARSPRWMILDMAASFPSARSGQS